MHRLFVAIRPPAQIRAILLSIMGGVPGARWQDDAQLHITVRFIGEMDARNADDIAAALGQIRHAAFMAAIKGVGEFDRKGRRDALWAGVAPHENLTSLHKKTDQALVRIGFPPEKRAYLPHITLARFGRASGAIDDFGAAHAGLSSPPFSVTHFGLFESRLGSSGAHYEMIERYPLSE